MQDKLVGISKQKILWETQLGEKNKAGDDC